MTAASTESPRSASGAPAAKKSRSDLTRRERAILVELWLQGVGAPKLARAFDVSQHEVYRLVREGA